MRWKNPAEANHLPPGFDHTVVFAEARRVLRSLAGQPGREVEFIAIDRHLPNGSVVRLAYSVDSNGGVYWTAAGRRVLLATLAMDAAKAA
jgi:hypothetical protein